LLSFRKFPTFMERENIHRIIQFKKNCDVLYCDHLGLIPSKWVWF